MLQVFLAVVALVLEIFADFFLEFVERGGVADVFGEVVVEVGELFILDAEDSTE